MIGINKSVEERDATGCVLSWRVLVQVDASDDDLVSRLGSVNEIVS